MLCLAVPQGTVDEIHELLKSGGAVVRPQLVDVQQLVDMLPLTRTRYVDKDTTVAAALRDGSIAYPFATIQAACDSLVASDSAAPAVASTSSAPPGSSRCRRKTAPTAAPTNA